MVLVALRRGRDRTALFAGVIGLRPMGRSFRIWSAPLRAERPLLWLIAATTLVRCAFAATTGLGVDESYMVTAGRTLSLGYFDHPPASWWLSWAAAHLFGSEQPIAVRMPFIALFVASQVLTARLTRQVADARAAFWAVVALNLSPVFGVTTATWVLPDGPLDAALLGAAACLLHALPARRPVPAACWWAGAGACAGLAAFAKYSAVLSIAGAVLFVASSQTHRPWLKRPQPYVAGLVALAVFSPVLLWNAAHGWASFAFQGDRAMGLRFRPLAPVATLGGEALFVLPWIWGPMMLLLVGALRRGRPWQDQLLGCLAVPPIAAFALISAWSDQRVLYHWAAPGYLMLCPLLGRAIAQRIEQRRTRWMIGATAGLVALALVVIAAQIQLDVLGNRLLAVMKQDPTMEALDWVSVRQALQARGALPDGTVVAALNWREAGKFGHALGPGVTMLCLDRDARQFRFAAPPSAFAGRDVLVLALAAPEQAAQRAAPWFQTVSVLPGTAIATGSRVVQPVTLLRGQKLLARR